MLFPLIFLYTKYTRGYSWIISKIFRFVPVSVHPYGSRRCTLNTLCKLLMIDPFVPPRLKLVLTRVYDENDLLCSTRPFAMLFVSFWIRAQKISILFYHFHFYCFQWEFIRLTSYSCAFNDANKYSGTIKINHISCKMKTGIRKQWKREHIKGRNR